jgi:L-threonylcarbamoyladenylate synthase
LFKNLLKQLDYPLAAPSANITTKVSTVQAKDVKEEFGNKIKYILDGGKCSVGIESTIIDLIGKPTILRLGGLDISKIQKTLGLKINLNINPKNKIAPGQSQLHYSPGIPIKMNVKKPNINTAFILIKKRKTKLNNYYYLSAKGNLGEAAKNLYSCLRKIKNRGYKSIAVEKIPNHGLGQAINDRLFRASMF